MKEYILLFRGGDGREMQQSPEKWQAHMQVWMQWMGALAEQGKLVGAQPLVPTGKVITGTQKMVTDGPYMEGKEVVGGYLICRAESEAEATEVAKGCPILVFDSGTVEVREVLEMKM